MKKTLLASTALVGASLLAAPASAGQVGSKDAYSVTLGGVFWFSAAVVDEDGANKSAGPPPDPAYGQDRGYKLAVVESEVHVNARATADNGMNYGVSIELNAGANDETVADEAWAFISNDSWGRLEMGDQDDVTNRMQLGSWNAHKGFGGPAGGLGMLVTGWHGLGPETLMSRSDYQSQPGMPSDSTKLNYFTPRFEGFQIGLSFTPDVGAASAESNESDSNKSYEGVISLAANYVGKFDDVGLGLSVERMSGDREDPDPDPDENMGAAAGDEDLSVWGFGGKLDVAGFTLGAHYRDFGDTFRTKSETAAGADGGNAWSVGLGFSSGPWGVSAWYTDAERDNPRPMPQSTVERLGFGAGYTVAPGWLMRADLEFMDHENSGGNPDTDNDGTGFLLTNMFLF